MTTRTDDSLVTLLLTHHLEKTSEPLTPKEYWSLLRRFSEPASLLGRDAKTIAVECEVGDEQAERIAALLDGSTSLAFELERMDASGIMMLSHFDDGYPARLLDRLGDGAPPFMYVVGRAQLLEADGIGIVGSRDIDAKAKRVAMDAAKATAARGLPVVSGAARGIDQVAMDAAFQAGGEVIGVLADSMAKKLRDPETRRAILDERVTLISPFNPTAPFNVGNAMARNKIIYGLSRCTLVVTATEDKGGTWAGATEAIRKMIAPVAIWSGPGQGRGNARLVELGGRAIHSIDTLFQLDRAAVVREESGPLSAELPQLKLDL